MTARLLRFFGWTILPLATSAQDLPQPEPRVTLSEAEHLGESLFVSDAVESSALDAAENASEPVDHLGGHEAGRHGRWRAEPRVIVKGTYDDNIFIQPEEEVADYIFTLAPGVTFGFWDADEEREFDSRESGIDRARGSFLVADYTAIVLNFAHTPSQNALDHDARLEAQWQGEKLTLGLRLHPESKSETSRDIGTRVQRRTLTAAATSTYHVTGKTALGLSVHHVTNDPEDYLRTVEWRAETSLDYAVTSKVRLGFGGAVGRVEVESGSDQDFQRMLARAAYAFDEKLDAEFRGGVEFRQSDGAEGDRTNPIFEFRTGWTPTQGTRVAVEAFRRLEVSAASPEQDYMLTGVALSLRQALRGGFKVTLDTGHHRASYTARGEDEGREDRYFFARPGLFYSFATWGTAGFSYEHRQNESSRDESGFTNNQATVEVALRY